METKKTNEINLMDIFIAIGKWLKKIFISTLNVVGLTLQLLYRNWILAASVLLLAIIIGQYMARPAARIYNVDAMCVLYGVEAPTIKEVGKQLSLSSPMFATTSLARKIALQDSIVSKVVGVEFFPVIDYLSDKSPDMIDFKRNHSLNDTTNLAMGNYVYLRMKIKGTNHAQEVGNAVLKYINSNPTVQNEYNIFKTQQKEKVKLCDRELSRIDSLANITYFKEKKPEIKFENNKLLIGNNTIQLFYGDLLNLQSIKNKAQLLLEEAVQPVVIPSGFIVNPTAINGRLKYGVLSLMFGLALSIACAYVLEKRKKWLNYLQGK